MVLTPLVDIVFLLLTFFMLSSQLSPFSMLTLDGERLAPRPPGAASQSAPTSVLLSVAPGAIRLNGRPVAASDLLRALRAEEQAGATRLTILAARDATVQDFVGALEAAKVAAFASISVANMR